VNECVFAVEEFKESGIEISNIKFQIGLNDNAK
jgi:hypothetical protein